MKKGKLLRMQLGLLVGLVAFSSVGPIAAAAEETDKVESITLSPTSKRYVNIKAGTTKTDTLTVVNDGKSAYDFILYTRPYSVNDESYVPDFTNNAQNADAYRWVQFDKPSYHLKAGESTKVGYTIRVPKTATPGGHYGVLFAETQPVDEVSGSAIKRKKRVGMILYTTVEGNVTTSGKLASTSVPFFQSKPPLTANIRVTNSGNTDFDVTTRMRVSDIFGGKKYSGERKFAVLPSTTRNARIEWPKASWLGLYKVELSTKFLDTNRSSTHYVLMVPLWVYLILGLLVGGRVVYAVAQRKRS